LKHYFYWKTFRLATFSSISLKLDFFCIFYVFFIIEYEFERIFCPSNIFRPLS